MARDTTTASHQTESADRALWRAAAASWQALAITVVALMFAAPALVVGVLIVVEAAISSSKPQVADRARSMAASPAQRVNGPHLLKFSNACTRIEPATCVAD
jgi:hypothetical protein